MLRVTTMRCLLVLSAVGILSLCAQAQVASNPAQTAGAWSEQLWTSARSGDVGGVDEIVDRLREREAVPVGVGLVGDIDRYEANIAKRELDRATRVGEVRTELQEKLAEATGDATGLRLGEALVLAMELVELHGGAIEAAALLGDPLIADAVARAEREARAAEAEGHWLKASELFYRLHVLFDIEQRFEDDIDRLGRRLTMIRLYAPEHYWEMRNARRIDADEPELPAYNGLGDSYQEKLAGLDKWIVSQSIQVAGTRHVDGNAMRRMVVGGLESVETMATTAELAETFAGLQDTMANQAFLANLESMKAEWSDPTRNLNPPVDLNRLMEALLALSRQTVGIPAEAIVHEFGNGAMSELDDYSTIIWPDEVRRFERNTRGEFIGVGVQIQHDELMRIKVVTPLEGTPAQRAGLRSDDLIVSVNGESTAGFTLDQAVDVITGKKGTKVTLGIEREEDGEEVTRDFVVVRMPIKLRSVKGWERTGASEEDWDWFVDEGSRIGYVRLTQFTENTSSDLRIAIDEMLNQGLQGLVLDLRFNPGGLLDQAVDVVGEFVESGVVVTTEDGRRIRTATERTRGTGRLADVPVAVLVNPGSASASEIVAGALQDYTSKGDIDAIVIGQRSFGKGSVQNAWPLQTRARAMLKVTTQYYRLPNGRLIHRRPGETQWGVEPDLAVDMLPSQNEEALTLRRDADVLPLDENGEIIVSDEPRADPNDLLTKGIDLQLETAVVLLKARAAGLQEARAAATGNSGA